MTPHRAPEPVAVSGRPVDRAVIIGLTLAAAAGLGWIAGMIYILATWPMP
ncbi:morphogenic membrane protein MmpA [Streptomyces sp. NPDC005931]